MTTFLNLTIYGLSDGAILALASDLLAERCPEAFAGLSGGLRMMAVDATVVAPPGPKRASPRRA